MLRIVAVAAIFTTLAGALIGALVADNRFSGAALGAFSGGLVSPALFLVWALFVRIVGIRVQ